MLHHEIYHCSAAERIYMRRKELWGSFRLSREFWQYPSHTKWHHFRWLLGRWLKLMNDAMTATVTCCRCQLLTVNAVKITNSLEREKQNITSIF